MSARAASELSAAGAASLAPESGPSAPRIEVKFALHEGALDAVETWLRTSRLAFRPAYAVRRINNLYFDTVEAGALADKLDGISARAKVRYRWYGESPAPAPGQLEVKLRRNGVGWKETFPVTAVPACAGRAAFVRALRAILPARARLWLDLAPEPMLINRYVRAYHVSADGRVRATVDRGLVAYDQRVGPFPQLTGRAPLPPVVVLELKLPQAARAAAVRELADLGFVASAYSKYEVALRAIADR